MQFWGNFTFNGFNDDRYKIVTVNDSEDRRFGLGKTINETESVGHTPLYYGEKREIPTLTIQITKMDRMGVLLPITDYDLHVLSRELFSSEDIGVLECKSHAGIVFYGKFIDGSIVQNTANQGYITTKFRLASPYGFSTVKMLPVRVTSTKTIDVIYNKSDIVNVIRPNIGIRLYGDTTGIEIINKTNGTNLKLTNLTKLDNIEICNDGFKEIVSKVDKTRNLFNNLDSITNIKWIELTYGKNILEINCNGTCDVAIKYQYPVSLK